MDTIIDAVFRRDNLLALMNPAAGEAQFANDIVHVSMVSDDVLSEFAISLTGRFGDDRNDDTKKKNWPIAAIIRSSRQTVDWKKEAHSRMIPSHVCHSTDARE